MSEITILDAHVHLHECFEVSAFLDHAYDSLERAARASNSVRSCRVLLLTECAGVNGFETLRRSVGAAVPRRGGWRTSPNDEPNSLTASSKPGRELGIVAGRQIVTAERLEILALGLAAEMPDGRPIDDVIAAVQAADALCVLPWGFGKWTGKRGRIFRRLLDRDLGPNFFLGDNSNRPALWPAPAEFEIAATKGIRMLSGSDPLPFARQISAVGRFGVVIERPIDRSRPFQEIRRLLLQEGERPKPYGRCERLLPFLRNQIAMQLRKRAG